MDADVRARRRRSRSDRRLGRVGECLGVGQRHKGRVDLPHQPQRALRVGDEERAAHVRARPRPERDLLAEAEPGGGRADRARSPPLLEHARGDRHVDGRRLGREHRQVAARVLKPARRLLERPERARGEGDRDGMAVDRADTSRVKRGQGCVPVEHAPQPHGGRIVLVAMRVVAAVAPARDVDGQRDGRAGEDRRGDVLHQPQSKVVEPLGDGWHQDNAGGLTARS
mmetsp:Transcript_50977/g.168812  ORF Transcript_50977/g.168812 Transcript_50977/m.168812 type:complete len:226 (-) Transcript_50977:180-857(-)